MLWVLLEPNTDLVEAIVVTLKQNVDDMMQQEKNFKAKKINGMKIE